MSSSRLDIHLFGHHNTTLDSFFRREVLSYIERCYLEDGGYFFARIPPSSGTDTRFAVKSLAILGVKPQNPGSVLNFFRSQVGEGTLSGVTGIFNAVEVIDELSHLSSDLKSYAEEKVMIWQNKAGGFGTTENIDVEVSSELQETYRAIKVLSTVGAAFDEKRVTRFVSSLLNQDGGYGRNGHSTLASTFYATSIQKLLAIQTVNLASTKAYLRKREESWQVQFIEDLYWLVEGLANLSEKSNFSDRIASFVMECQRVNGGFSRATIMGIPTLEYTFYALSILREVGFL